MIVGSLETEKKQTSKQKKVLNVVIKALSVRPLTLSLPAESDPVTKSKLWYSKHSIRARLPLQLWFSYRLQQQLSAK